MKNFWLHFSSAYGTIWFVLFFIAIITQTKIETGEFGLYGFPIIAGFYAWYKINAEAVKNQDVEQLKTDLLALHHEVDRLRNSQNEINRNDESNPNENF